MTAEKWIAIPRWEHRYEVSDMGRVRSIGKFGRVLRLATHRGYSTICLSEGRQQRATRPVHQLVLEAFVGPKPEGDFHTRHLDGDRSNNHLSNLAYGTRSENSLDRARLGECWMARRDRCDKGHPFDEENTYVRVDGGRRGCRICRREWVAQYEHRKRGGIGQRPDVIRRWARANGLPIKSSGAIPKAIAAAYYAELDGQVAS